MQISIQIPLLRDSDNSHCCGTLDLTVWDDRVELWLSDSSRSVTIAAADLIKLAEVLKTQQKDDD